MLPISCYGNIMCYVFCFAEWRSESWELSCVRWSLWSVESGFLVMFIGQSIGIILHIWNYWTKAKGVTCISEFSIYPIQVFLSLLSIGLCYSGHRCVCNNVFQYFLFFFMAVYYFNVCISNIFLYCVQEKNN